MSDQKIQRWSIAICSFVIAASFGGICALGIELEPQRALANSNVPEPQEAADTREEDREASKPIAWGDLPQPPPEILKLIGGHELEFSYGPEDRIRRTEQGWLIEAETRFRFSYDYSIRYRTQRADDSSRATVRFPRLELKRSHEIWFRRLPDLQKFWSDRLVLHELEHFRISSDPRIESRFLSGVKKLDRLSFATGGDVQSELKDLVRKHVQETFSRLVDEVRVRYVELDRITQHGRVPLERTED
ncbi:MAG: hypothetical protein AAF664_11815 [Planctomycetota bacterium]